jgi:DNA-binding CsgD family transcriptional regulator
VLHGRDADCAAVRELLDAARLSRSGVAVVRGEPGVGKTALLQYAAEHAQNMHVLHGVGVQSEVMLPFAALHQLLRPVLEHLPALPAPQAGALAGAFGIAPGRGDDPFLVAVAVLTLLSEVSGAEGLLCVIDDAQWLDQASADALVFVARRLMAEGVLLLFAARDGERRSFPAPGLPERRLRGLDPASADALLEDAAPGLAPHVRARLVDRTAGNPLALLELPALLTPRQRAGSEALPDPMPLGSNVERIFAERAGHLPPNTQQLLLIAAAEETGDLATIMRACAVDGIEIDALDAAEQAGLVSVHGGRLRFRHPLVRSAVYQRSTFAARQRVHRVLAAALPGAEDVDRRAWHLATATLQFDDDVAAELEHSADRARRRGGVAAAADALERAAYLSKQQNERGKRLLGAAKDAWLAGQRDRAARLLAAAEPVLEDRVQRASGKQLGGLIELRRGMPEKAYHLLLDSAREFADLDVHIALETLVLAGEAASFIGDPDLAAEVGRLALAMPETSSSQDRLMAALLVGLASALHGDPADGIALLREVVDGAGRLEDPAQLLWAGRAALYLGELDVARALYQRGVDRAEQTGAAGMLAILLDRIAWTEAIAGRPAQAAANAERGMELAGELGLDAGVALGSLALVGAIRGDEQACRAAAERAHALADARHLRIVAAAADWALGLLELGLGRPAEALNRLLALTGQKGHPGILLWAAPDLVEAAARAGRPDLCEAVAERFERWATGSGLPVPAAAAARCRGLLSHADEAVEQYTTALQYDRSAERPFERARTELALGEELRRMRRRSEARTHLREAMEVFERLGAAPWAERARTELRASGETARRRDPSTLQQLTPQELQVARLAGGGASNPDIAAKLFLSRRTVEYHLQKVFSKLGVASRVELARVDFTEH